MVSNDRKLIAVIGATGQQGGAVVRALQAGGQFTVRALTRNPGKHRELAEEVVEADLDRRETLKAAFEGAHGVFLVTNFWEEGTDELKQATAAVRAAKDTGVKHFVWSTLPNVEAISGGKFDVPHFTGKAKINPIVADRPWMLLDEPTAHLDEVTERVITDTLVELGRRGAVVVVAHRSALMDVADRLLVLRAPEERPPATAAVAPSRRTRIEPVPDETLPLPAARFGLSTLLGALASASGVALTATAGWLIVQASSHPPVLTMLVAIVGVRTFGLARPVLRYAERMRSHDAALRLLARRRAEVYDAVVPLTPGRLGRRRGDLLTSVVDDVDSEVDRRAAGPDAPAWLRARHGGRRPGHPRRARPGSSGRRSRRPGRRRGRLPGDPGWGSQR